MPVTSQWAYAYGHLDVTVVVLASPVDEVRAQLKAHLRLAAQSLTPAGTHPQILLFGQHSRVRSRFDQDGAGGHYDEWIVATPFLEWVDAQGRATPWATMSRLYLNSLWYTALGWTYGYPKELARISVPPNGYQVHTLPGGEPRVDMRWQAAGPQVPWTQSGRATAVASVFGQPFIDRLGPLPWLGSRMWFELDLGTMQPATVQAQIHEGCAPNFPGRHLDVGSIEGGVPGAFRLSCDWMLSRPYLAASLPPQLRLPMPPDCEDVPHA